MLVFIGHAHASADRDYSPLSFEDGIGVYGHDGGFDGEQSQTFNLPGEHEYKERPWRRIGLVRLAQANFDFTGFGKRRRHRVKPTPQIKIYTAPKVKTYQPPKSLFGFLNKPKHLRPAYRARGTANYYIIYGSDGRAYRVYQGRNKRMRNNQLGGLSTFRTSPYSGYRTMCVRTCDGFYYPVSNSTRRSRLRRDSNICQSSCGVPAKLFYYPNPGGSIENMVDLRGKRYSSMKYAFKYRKKLVNECRCKEQPWAQSEIIRHEQYAADEVDRGIKRVKLVKVAEIPETSSRVPAEIQKGRFENQAGRENPDDDMADHENIEETADAEDGSLENKVPETAPEHMLARRRYRMSARRMMRWWRSRRY